jgi:hypothetical protein
VPKFVSQNFDSRFSFDFRVLTEFVLLAVMTGKVYKCPGLMNGAPLMKGYHSHVSPNGTEIVIFNTRQILPTYIVHYQTGAAGLHSDPLKAVPYNDDGFAADDDDAVDSFEDEGDGIQYF